jgi:predicted  nucleic acid-binding Zn-ribbon protein
LEAKDQLSCLLRIQELVIEIRGATKIIDCAPGRIDDAESRFRDRNAEYVAVKDRFDALEADQRHRTGELALLEEKRKKFMDDLMQVKNQREYAAMLKEIDSVKAMISEHEDAVLTDMEEIEKLKVELVTHEEHIKAEREIVEKERVDVEDEADAARQNLERLHSERKQLEAELPIGVLQALRRLEAKRQGIFLSRVENATCQSCYVRVRLQVFQEIKIAAAVHNCSNCRRFLYFEPALRQEQEKAGSGDSVGAVNGGAV